MNAMGWALGAGVLLAATVAVGVWRWAAHDGPDTRVVYSRSPQGALELDVFRPRGVAVGTTGVPALVFFHGGAWQGGTPQQFHPQCRHFSGLGLMCFSVHYRVAERHGTRPADAVQDARDAMRYLRREAATLGIDPRRIAAGGGSSGGHLAASLGTSLPLPDARADAPESWRADALLLLNPMLDFAPGMPDHPLVAEQWAELSPRRHIDAAMPPTLIMSGTLDPEVAVETVRDFCAGVQAQGRRCDLALHEGATHAFFNPGRGDGQGYPKTLAEMTAFLRSLGWLPAR